MHASNFQLGVPNFTKCLGATTGPEVAEAGFSSLQGCMYIIGPNYAKFEIA
jgi:hypothetical protein